MTGTLFAISYQVLPELRREVEGWEVRCLLTLVGLLAVLVLRSRPVRRPVPTDDCTRVAEARRRWRGGALASTVLWVGVDVVRGEAFLAELVVAAPTLHENAVRGLVLVGFGWTSWAWVLGEANQRLRQGSGSTLPPH
jgi:hypothetical protein